MGTEDILVNQLDHELIRITNNDVIKLSAKRQKRKALTQNTAGYLLIPVYCWLLSHIHFKCWEEMRLPGCTDSVLPNDKSKGNKINGRGPERVPSWCFHQLCNARGRCWLMLYTQLSRLHFLAFQVADSSEWHVELFARNSVPHKHSASAHTSRTRGLTHKHTLAYAAFRSRLLVGIMTISLHFDDFI